MTKRICATCGSELEENTKFCTHCGEEYIEKKTTRRGKTKKEEEVVEEPKVDVEAIKASLREELLSEVKKESDKREREIKADEIDLASFKSKLKVYPILACVTTLLLCLVAFGFFYNYYMKHLVIETTRLQKEVTVNEHGISDAVEKVYDATVVVESYVHGRLYATGSGFVFKSDDNYGYILTNDHVISNATEVKVLFTNEKRVEVKVLGSDSYSDIAVLRVGKDDVISVAEIGKTSELKLGDTAFAVGAPLDSSTYAWTVTRGIISGKNRTVEVSSSNRRSTQVMEVLQTDAAINSGNSGGPLCNSNGEVIGITNMKLASSSIEGMGFAIPIETALKMAETFIDGKPVSYPYLGVFLEDMADEEGGVMITEIEKGSPADKAGLKTGDVVKKINNTKVTNASFLKYELYKHSVGDKINLTIERDGKEKVVEVTLGSNGDKA